MNPINVFEMGSARENEVESIEFLTKEYVDELVSTTS